MQSLIRLPSAVGTIPVVAQAALITASDTGIGIGATSAVRTEPGAWRLPRRSARAVARRCSAGGDHCDDRIRRPRRPACSSASKALRPQPCVRLWPPLFGPSTSAASGADLFGSTPSQFADSIEAADAVGTLRAHRGHARPDRRLRRRVRQTSAGYGAGGGQLRAQRRLRRRCVAGRGGVLRLDSPPLRSAADFV